MVHSRFIGLFAAAVLALFPSCSIMKKCSLKDTAWIGEYQMFVADVGTQTSTVDLRFVSSKEFEMTTRSEMPPHPAMYMNPDGTVDTLPGFTSEWEERGTYTIKNNTVTLTVTDGPTYILHMTEEGGLVCDRIFGEGPVQFYKK